MPFASPVVVGVDGSSASIGALEFAAPLAAALAVPLVAVRGDVPDPDGAAAIRVLHDDARAELGEWCSSAVGPVPCEALVSSDGPADAVCAVAAERLAGLVAVGTRSTSGASGPRWGSVSHELARRAAWPLLVVPPGAVPPIERIVVGVDGSPGSDAAVLVAARLAEALDIPVRAVHAFDPVFEWVMPSNERSLHRFVDQQMAYWVEPLHGVELDTVVDRTPSPVTALASESDAATLVLVGLRASTGHAVPRVGRVPLRLVEEGGFAVVMTPPPIDLRSSIARGEHAGALR